MGDEDLLAPDVERAARPPGIQPFRPGQCPRSEQRGGGERGTAAVRRITVDADDRPGGAGLPGADLS
jgi:hypothetical protein